MSRETAETLRKAKALIDAPEKWTKYRNAAGPDGAKRHSSLDPTATCFCSMGALIRTVPGWENKEQRRLAAIALERAGDIAFPDLNPVVEDINDHVSMDHAAAMAWWDRAIAAEEQTP